MSNKRILITGGAGFLGMSLARKLKDLGYNVWGIGHGRPDAGLYDYWYTGDITFKNLKLLGFNSGFIIHCAGGSSVFQSVQDPLTDFNKTVGSSIELLEYVKLFKDAIKVIYISSAAVYGIQPNAPIIESSHKDPVSPYGFHKLLAEELFLHYKKVYGISVVITRLFSVYGPGLKKQLLWDAYNKLQNSTDGAVEFWGDGSETRDWVYIDDVVDLFQKLLVAEDLPHIINIGSGTSTTIEQTISIMCETLEKKQIFYFNNKFRIGDPKYYLADISNAKFLQWEPKTDLYQGIKKYVNWVINA